MMISSEGQSVARRLAEGRRRWAELCEMDGDWAEAALAWRDAAAFFEEAGSPYLAALCRTFQAGAEAKCTPR